MFFVVDERLPRLVPSLAMTLLYGAHPHVILRSDSDVGISQGAVVKEVKEFREVRECAIIILLKLIKFLKLPTNYSFLSYAVE